MKYKDGVWIEVIESINGAPVKKVMSEDIAHAVEVADELMKQHYPNIEFVITSVFDGRHKAGSFHYRGEAFDQRSRSFKTSKDLNDYIMMLRKSLGPDYDVLFETDHIHIEYDPKH